MTATETAVGTGSIYRRFFSGLDLGKLSDPSALSCIEQRTEIISTLPDPERKPRPGEPPWSAEKRVEKKRHTYALLRLERYDLGTSYPKIVERMVDLFFAEPLRGSILVPDETGVGEPVVDMLKSAKVDGILKVGRLVREKLYADLKPMQITAGSGASPNGAGWRVSKKQLASCMQVVLQQRRFKIAPFLKYAQALIRELENFTVKISESANESYEAWRSTAHDDLVLSVCMPIWLAERGHRQWWIK